MTDLISRQALCEYALNQKDKSITPNEIMRFPSAYPKKGKWIKADTQQYFRKHYPFFTCSVCGYRKDSQKKWDYCPNCGADMRNEE